MDLVLMLMYLYALGTLELLPALNICLCVAKPGPFSRARKRLVAVQVAARLLLLVEGY